LRLFEIHEQIEHIINTGVDPDTGEIGEDALAALEGLELARADKALAIAAYLKGERCEADAVWEQGKRLQERADKHYKRADRLEELIRAYVPAGEKLRDERCEISWRKSTAVEVSNENLIPLDYMRVQTSVDLKAIGAALESGEKVPGAELVHRQKMQVK